MDFVWDDSTARSGERSACLVVGASNISWLPLDASTYAVSLAAEDLPALRPTAVVGHEYVLAAWVRGEGSGKQGAALVLRWTNEDGWVPDYVREYFQLDGDAWQLICVSAVAPEGARNVVPILQVSGSPEPGRLWFDDISLADRTGLSCEVSRGPELDSLPDCWQCDVTVRGTGEGLVPVVVSVRPSTVPYAVEPTAGEVSRTHFVGVGANYQAEGPHRVSYTVTSPDDPPAVYHAATVAAGLPLSTRIDSPRYRSTVFGDAVGRELVVGAHVRAAEAVRKQCVLRVRVWAAGKMLGEQVFESPMAASSLRMPLPDGLAERNQVSVRLEAGETLLAEETLPLRHLPDVQPVARIGERNELLVNGKPTFPIGFYSTLTEDFGRFRQDGFNTVLTYTSSVESCAEMARKAGEAGLNLIVSALRPAVEGRDSAHVGSATEALKTIPGLLGYYLWDEPSPSQPNQAPADMRWLYEQAVEQDPSHLTCTVFCRPSEFGLYADTTDVYLVDPYPTHRDRETDMEMAARWVDAARAAVEGRKPVWLVPQAFDHLLGPGSYRMPTVEEQRCMCYLGLVHGAKGILWFVYTGFCIHSEELAKQQGLPAGQAAWVYRGTIPQCFPGRYAGIKQIVREVNELAPVLLAEDPTQDQEIRQGAKAVHTLLKVQEDRQYLFAVNVRDEQATFACAVPGLGGTVEVLWEDRTVTAEDGVLTDAFAPYEVHVYRWPAG